jgi:hypothetical protein
VITGCGALGAGRAAAAGFGLGWRAGRIAGACSRTNVTGGATALAPGTVSARCALGSATTATTATSSVAAATRPAVPPSTVLPQASIEVKLNGSANSSWSPVLSARTGGIAGSFGRGLM